MIQSPRPSHPAFRLRHILPSCLTLLVLVLAGCGAKKAPPAEWPLGFRLVLPPEFTMSGGLRPNGEGTLYFLRGDEPDQARLTVRKNARRLELEDHLAAELEQGGAVVLLEEGETYVARAVNGEGLGRQVRIQPVPELDSSLVLLLDVRVFARGDFAWTFLWQQLPEDTLQLRDYHKWMEKLVFLDPPEEREEEEEPAEGDAPPGTGTTP